MVGFCRVRRLDATLSGCIVLYMAYSLLDEKGTPMAVDCSTMIFPPEPDEAPTEPVAHLFAVQTKTWKSEWKLSRKTRTPDGGHGFMVVTIPVGPNGGAEQAQKLATAMLPPCEVRWEQTGDTHFVAVPA